MNILRVRCRNLEEFEEHYRLDIPTGGVFCPTTTELAPGTAVVVEMACDGLPNKVLIRGTVTAWRPALPRMRVRAGATVAFEADESAKRDFMIETLRGERPATRSRKHTRIPIGIPCRIRIAAGLDLIDAELREISVSGGLGPGPGAAAHRHRRRPGDHPARQRGAVRPFRAASSTMRATIRPAYASSTAKAAGRAGCASWSADSRRCDPRPPRAALTWRTTPPEAESMRKTLPYVLSLGLLTAWPARRAPATTRSRTSRASSPPRRSRSCTRGRSRPPSSSWTRAAKAKDRKALAKATGLKPAELLELVHRCDLLRIKGVGSEMVLLFEAAGVKSTADLVTKDPAALTAAMDEANKTAKISEKPPDRAAAGRLDRAGQEASPGRRNEIAPRIHKPPTPDTRVSVLPEVLLESSTRMAPGRDSLAVSAQQGQFQPGRTAAARCRRRRAFPPGRGHGQDAVSQTYRATDANRRGPAAVRIIPMRALGTAAAQLVTDVENASALVHKNLIEVLSAGREADSFFIATELLDGQTLREFIDGKRSEGRNVSFKGACNLITHVANGLERAAGFMPHGGLNPAAIWVNKAGRVKVGELGLGRTVPALARRGAPDGAPDHRLRRARGAGRRAADARPRTSIRWRSCFTRW